MEKYWRTDDFVEKEFASSYYLLEEGWDKASLLAIFTSELSGVDKLPDFDQAHRFYTNLEGHNRRKISEPWWHDFQEYVKSGLKPIPPLLPGWKESNTNNGINIHKHQLSGTVTQSKPIGSFFSNLQTKEARNASKAGKTRIETEV